ncbi:hypothetical protein NSR00_14360 [Aeribacillus sp. FSL K6-8394]|uniref:hypothetical protein n=1 Tax=Aeribacillus sp. FSL K6-8394 TaxID=2954570 RepID=UPI0030F6EBC8
MKMNYLSLFPVDVFNQLTNRVQYQNIDWEKFQELGNDLIDEINNILSKDVPSEMEIDLERIMQLIQKGSQNHDSNTAIYIHRILHDLDIEYNDYEQTKFGFSNYDGGGAEQPTVDQYIKEHKELADMK